MGKSFLNCGFDLKWFLARLAQECWGFSHVAPDQWEVLAARLVVFLGFRPEVIHCVFIH
ncbi:MAG TPA: hypothetical protein PLK99_10185 [Burkholderiales bacterium]|nr:hypothetical protein [Burkholderiales bacterium]